MSMSPEYDTMLDYSYAGKSIDLTNVSYCVPQDQFIQFCHLVVFKTDAIKLGLLCFFLGIGFWMLVSYLEKRWSKQ